MVLTLVIGVVDSYTNKMSHLLSGRRRRFGVRHDYFVHFFARVKPRTIDRKATEARRN